MFERVASPRTGALVLCLCVGAFTACGEDFTPAPVPAATGGSGGGNTGGAQSAGGSGTTGGQGGTAGVGGSGGALTLGEACDSGGQCASGECVDGVCCDTACDSICESCDLSGTEGTCTPDATGDDPADDCGQATCDGEGACLYGEHLWSKRFGDGDLDLVTAVATDASGNVIVAGNFEGSINLGGDNLSGNAAFASIFVAKFDSTGAHQWSKRFLPSGGGGKDADVKDVAIDSTGAVLLTGDFDGIISFGGDDLDADTGPISGFDHVFLAKLDSDGNHVWSAEYGTGSSSVGHSLSVDGADNVLLGGRNNGGSGLNFGGGNMLCATAFVAKLNSGGELQWLNCFGWQTGDGTTYAVTTDSNGSVWVTGTFSGTINLGGNDLVNAGGGRNIFFGEFDANGNHQWSKKIGTDAGNLAMVRDGAGDLVMTGRFDEATNFGGGELTPAGDDDVFLAKFDDEGNHTWSKHFGDADAEEQYPGDVAIDGDDNIVLVGEAEGTVDFGAGDLTSAGGTDLFIAKFTSDGTPIWSRLHGDNQDQPDGPAGNSVPCAVAIGADDTIAVGSAFNGEIDFGGTLLPSAGQEDVALTLLGP